MRACAHVHACMRACDRVRASVRVCARMCACKRHCQPACAAGDALCQLHTKRSRSPSVDALVVQLQQAPQAGQVRAAAAVTVTQVREALPWLDLRRAPTDLQGPHRRRCARACKRSPQLLQPADVIAFDAECRTLVRAGCCVHFATTASCKGQLVCTRHCCLCGTSAHVRSPCFGPASSKRCMRLQRGSFSRRSLSKT